MVRLTAFEGRNAAQVEAIMLAAVEALALALGVAPGNVFLVYQQVGSGRVYSGGEIRRRT